MFSRSSSLALVAVVAVTLVACDRRQVSPGTGDTAVVSRVDSQPRLVATARVFGGDNPPEPPRVEGLPAEGDAYEQLIAGRLLADVRDTTTILPRPTDNTNLTNYQASSWGFDFDSTPRRQHRFHLGFNRLTSGVLAITMDTGGRFDDPAVDSVAVRGLGRWERLSTRCRVGRYAPDERVVGIVRDTVAERWMPPRRVWLFDTRASRIREMSADSVACWLEPSPD